MKTYNRSLDYITLAMATARKGDAPTAAKLFAKAIASPDSIRAIAILEASNKQAFAATAAAKAKPTSAAAKRIKADAEFDMGEDEDIDSLVSDEDTSEEPAVEEAVVEEAEDEDDDFDEQFASVLATMNKKAKR